MYSKTTVIQYSTAIIQYREAIVEYSYCTVKLLYSKAIIVYSTAILEYSYYTGKLLYSTVERSIRYTIYTSQVIELWEITWEGGEQDNHCLAHRNNGNEQSYKWGDKAHS